MNCSVVKWHTLNRIHQSFWVVPAFHIHTLYLLSCVHLSLSLFFSSLKSWYTLLKCRNSINVENEHGIDLFECIVVTVGWYTSGKCDVLELDCTNNISQLYRRSRWRFNEYQLQMKNFKSMRASQPISIELIRPPVPMHTHICMHEKCILTSLHAANPLEKLFEFSPHA